MKIDKASIGGPASRHGFDLLIGGWLVKREEPLQILPGPHIIPWKDLDSAEPSQQNVFGGPPSDPSEGQECLTHLLIAHALHVRKHLRLLDQEMGEFKRRSRLLTAPAQLPELLFGSADE